MIAFCQYSIIKSGRKISRRRMTPYSVMISLIPVPTLLDHLQVPCRFYFFCHGFAPFCRSRLKIKEAADT